MRVIVFDLQGTLVDYGSPPALFPDSRSCLESLRGETLALVSTGRGIENLDSVLVRLGIRDHFAVVLHLKDTVLRKEDGSAFREIAQRFDVPSAALVVIGDVPVADIAGAHQCGAFAIRIRRGIFASLTAQTPEEIPDIELPDLTRIPSLIRTGLPNL